MSTTSKNTGNLRPSTHGWDDSEAKAKKVKDMLKNRSKEDIIRYLLRISPSGKTEQ